MAFNPMDSLFEAIKLAHKKFLIWKIKYRRKYVSWQNPIWNIRTSFAGELNMEIPIRKGVAWFTWLNIPVIIRIWPVYAN